MTDDFVIKYINKKLQECEDENFIRYTFYELRVKNNLEEKDLDRFFIINKNYFENNGYKVYFTGAKFKYKNANMTVQPNELMIAIKEKEWGNRKMGLFNDESELELLKNAGVKVEKNKEYTTEEKRYICMQVSDFIMSHSSKNGDIAKLQSDYNNILKKVVE